jgi:hypothetical protein
MQNVGSASSLWFDIESLRAQVDVATAREQTPSA